jgi:ankyrin repeat protein
MSSCNGQGNSQDAQKKEASNLQVHVEAPAMDLHAATFMGDLKAVQQHISAGTDLNQKDDYGSTPLITAAVFGKSEIALALIKGGADLNLKSDAGSTPLHSAAFFCRVKITEDLLANGADKNLIDTYGSTPLASVAGPFNDVKGIYDQISKDLGPFGFKLDYGYLEVTRPKIAALLQ